MGETRTKMLINKFRRGEGRGVGTWSKIVPIRISHFPRGTNIFSSMDEVIITEVTTLQFFSEKMLTRFKVQCFFLIGFLMFN